MEAYNVLVKLGWLPKRGGPCVQCGAHDRWTPPALIPSRGVMGYRTCNKCKSFQSVYVHPVFEGLRIKCGDLYFLAWQYSMVSSSECPSVKWLQKQCGTSRIQTEHFVEAVLWKESTAGELKSQTNRFMGAVEGDCHALRISSKNPHFQTEIERARSSCARRHIQTSPKTVWVVHNRLAGLVQRGGPLSVWKMPSRVVQKNAVPPIESVEELMACPLLQQFALDRQGHKAHLFLDGCRNWDYALQKLKAKHVNKPNHVKHGDKQFFVKNRGKKPDGGTQTLDCIWGYIH